MLPSVTDLVESHDNEAATERPADKRLRISRVIQLAIAK